MPKTQADAAGIDQNGNPIAMFGAEFGDIRTMPLVTADGTAIALSKAAGYPDNPTITSWVLQNDNTGASDDAFVGGSEVASSLGLHLPRKSNSPGSIPPAIGLMTDPGQTFVLQDSGGPLTFLLTICGKDLR